VSAFVEVELSMPPLIGFSFSGVLQSTIIFLKIGHFRCTCPVDKWNAFAYQKASYGSAFADEKGTR
jgi:hypothetical protein